MNGSCDSEVSDNGDRFPQKTLLNGGFISLVKNIANVTDFSCFSFRRFPELMK